MFKKTVNKFIQAFDFIPEFDPRYTKIKRPMIFTCYSGWEDILWKACQGINKLLKNYKEKEKDDLSFIVFQIKEKLRGLRVYTNYNIDDKHKEIVNKIFDLISEAETESYFTCEVCGDKGTGYTDENNVWLYTRCSKCAEKENLKLINKER